MAGGFPISDGGGAARAAGVAAAGAVAAASDRLCVNLALPSVDPDEVGGVRLFCENDAGTHIGAPHLQGPECDDDFRIRSSLDTVIDNELFNYAAQNTGKFAYHNTTLAATWNQGGWLTNSGNVTTTATALRQRSYAVYNLHGTRRTYVEMFVGFSASTGPTNTSIDFGLFIDSAANPYAPTDGVYVSLTNGSWSLNANFNGSTTGQSQAFATFTPVANQKYKFCLAISQNDVELWINDELHARINKDAANPQMFACTALPWAFRHAIVGGAASTGFQCSVGGYFVSYGGGGPASFEPGALTNAAFGSYQGGSGGVMGGLAWGNAAVLANNFVPTAAVPSNTALTANLIAGLGGHAIETDTLAVATDGIIMSYQVPVTAVGNNSRRLAVHGIKIDGHIVTTLTGGGYNALFQLAFGHTAVSLATADAATTKAPRRLPLGGYSLAAAAAALLQLPTVQMSWRSPIIVNPGEFIAVSRKKVGTAPSAGAIGYTIVLDYTWI